MKLFLDDHINPDDVVGDIYEGGGWQVVGNYHEFIAFVMEEGVPEVVSFDHDLVDEHYGIDWCDIYEGGMLASTSEPTGLDCAKWLYDFCHETKTALPMALCHSLNPKGREVIERYITKWNK